MPKHLYTIPSGAELPDPTGLPEGYPFLTNGGLHILQGGVFIPTGGGGGASPDTVLVPAQSILGFDASSAEVARGNYVMPHLLMPGGEDSTYSFTATLPEDWSWYTATLLLYPGASGASGDVMFSSGVQGFMHFATGDVSTSYGALGITYTILGYSGTTEPVTLEDGGVPAAIFTSSGGSISIELSRLGSNVGDTAGNVALVGIRLDRAEMP